ncbi:MAG: hypothetical protein Ct9H90mP18_07220 [Gammaproteobacteria bacterium]|nr:MAG: hypothetical protein Ct9H90mP18_07220 [Gammaproteobacteria bacterium]
MLTVILFRCMKGHFAGDNHFGFEAVAWYWHFVMLYGLACSFLCIGLVIQTLCGVIKPR